jgi:FAD/FMN-containing dehydrogenase
LSYLQVQKGFDPFFPKGEFMHYWKSLYLDHLSDAAIDLIVDRYQERPSPRTLISIRYQGGAVRRVEATETAFGDRSAQVLVSIDSTWKEVGESDRNIAWTRAFWSALKPYSSGRTYFNFPGLLEEGDDLVRATFGANYERLVALKNKYDPTNLFRLNQNIRPAVRVDHGL